MSLIHWSSTSQKPKSTAVPDTQFNPKEWRRLHVATVLPGSLEMFPTQLLVALLSAAAFVSAAPGPNGPTAGCDTSAAVMDLPANQTQLVAPTTPPLFILLGVGTKNFTCSGTTFTSLGAVASLFDISCIQDHPSDFNTIQTRAFDRWVIEENVPSSSIGADIKVPTVDGFHFFVPSPSGTGISPEWDFTSVTGNPNDFVIGEKVGDIPDPTGDPAFNVDWLQLKAVEGQLASQIFVIDTVGGQPPASCVAGDPDIQVKYTSKVYLF
ncbi:hypothetical protein MVEN_00666900 [Mycena venus]|uniref:Malate dehydrogenase n=1 Tax=Mycena venus TaxID=2733690 RepID=A0A8H7D5L0_9AGAR|nr:hypothetical protein MVEN_00666900 [Mycena venus]